MAIAGLISVLGVLGFAGDGAAETLLDALASAFKNNPALNATRESALATRENLPKAAAGYMPKLGASGEAGYRKDLRSGNRPNDDTTSYGVTLQARQPVFDGFKTRYSVKQAVAQDRGARELLRNSEHAMLFDTARVYADVYANRQILDLSGRYVAALGAQLKLVKSLHEFGDTVASDVAEVEARLAEAMARQSRAQAALEASAADYERIVGAPPGRLAPPPAIDAAIAPSREIAIETALARHPAILAAKHGEDESDLQVEIVKSAYLPALDVVASTSMADASNSTDRFDAAVVAQLTVPIYSGGETGARTRQAGHVAAQRRLETYSVRDGVRAAAIAAWSQLTDAKARIRAGGLQVKSAKVALDGVRMAYRIGERTNLDVLESERDLSNAQISLAAARRDYVVATYAIAQTTGMLEFPLIESALQRSPRLAQTESSEPIAVPLARTLRPSAIAKKRKSPDKAPMLRSSLVD
jgi:outer membrane protein